MQDKSLLDHSLTPNPRMIHFYELKPAASRADLSIGYLPLTRTVILILNYKKLPYQIHQISPKDIRTKLKSFGILLSEDGGETQFTTYPILFIHDTTTNQVVFDSLDVAEYLDEAYPDTPRVIPRGTRVLQHAFSNNILSNMFALHPVLCPQLKRHLSPEVLAQQRKILGSKILDVELEPEEAWRKVKASFEALGKAFGRQKGTFIMGEDSPTFADFTLVSFIWCVNVAYGEHSQEWDEVRGWASGRIGRLCEEVMSICR
ncbi:hypothetical protein E1B28_002841 [Marasmius oreades]|uniref:GST N-terminal domain-containing protein n=1 Tax=Marasmius oreades TaxID=181124 RepID=A0A9P7RNU7_9AGAR|nr:uncharacterized protein E1B28_002841 [Marasmius oreades]KAG7086925.1 hypothetical protein E1B28_002841 [Marasmius oreades]